MDDQAVRYVIRFERSPDGNRMAIVSIEVLGWQGHRAMHRRMSALSFPSRARTTMLCERKRERRRKFHLGVCLTLDDCCLGRLLSLIALLVVYLQGKCQTVNRYYFQWQTIETKRRIFSWQCRSGVFAVWASERQNARCLRRSFERDERTHEGGIHWK